MAFLNYSKDISRLTVSPGGKWNLFQFLETFWDKKWREFACLFMDTFIKPKRTFWRTLDGN